MMKGRSRGSTKGWDPWPEDDEGPGNMGISTPYAGGVVEAVAPDGPWRVSNCISSAMDARLGRCAATESRLDMVKSDGKENNT